MTIVLEAEVVLLMMLGTGLVGFVLGRYRLIREVNELKQAQTRLNERHQRVMSRLRGDQGGE